MKKLVSVLLCLALVAAMAVTAFADGSVDFSMNASASELERGDTLTINVSVSSSTEAISYALKLSYDTDVFEIVEGVCAPEEQTLVASFNNGFAFMFGAATDYSGNVGTVTLKVKDTAVGGDYTIEGITSVKNGSAVVPANGDSVTVSVNVPCDHSYGEWGANGDVHTQTCELCGAENSEGHNWDDGVVVSEADCEVDGEMLYTCETCGAEETEAIPAPGHSWDDGEVTLEPTCTEEGEVLYTCEVCGAEETDVIPASGHSYGSWTTTVAPTTESTGERQRVCEVCGHTQTEVVPAVSSPATGDTQLILWTTLMAISACGVAAIAFFSTKKKETI